MSKEFPDITFVNVDGQAVPFTKPQHYKKGSTTDTLLTGEDNPLPTKDESVEARLQAIEQTQSQILDKLNDTIDTRLTGSNVEDGILTKSKGTLVEIGRVTNYTMSPGSIKYAVIRGGILSEKFFVGIREADGIRHDFDIELAFYDSETNSGLYGYEVMKKIENSHAATTEHMPIMGNEIGIGIRNRDDIEHKYNIVVWGVG